MPSNVLKLLLIALLAAVAYTRQVSFVDLSKQDEHASQGGKYPPGSGTFRGGGVLGHGALVTTTPTIRLVLTRFIPTRTALTVRYIAEVVITNISAAAISIPVGADAESLLAPTQHDRSGMMFSAAFAQSGRGLTGTASASNSGHPETSALLEPGDTVVFLIPIGTWLVDKVPSEEIGVTVWRERKVLEGGIDYTEIEGQKIRSENALSLPPPPPAGAP